jgi:hypothetical protein
MIQPEEKPPASVPVESVLVIKTTPAENEAWSKAALAKGMILSDWAIDALRSAYHTEQAEAHFIAALPDSPLTHEKQA